MAWCEANGVDYVFGLARNARLAEEIAVALAAGRRRRAGVTGEPARRFKDFQCTTRESWSRRRRVIGKAEWTQGEANPRFVVTSLGRAERRRPPCSTRRSTAPARRDRAGKSRRH